MQRIIKFRGKRVDNGEWVYGSLAFFFNSPENAMIMPNCYFGTRDMGEQDPSGNPIISDEIALGGFIPVYPKTVGQFTGLTDKKGKEIYEGDILKEYYSRGYVYKVFSVQGGFAINTHQDDLAKDNIVFYSSLADMQNSGYITQCTEVIGNIHENPELCKG